MSNEYGGYQNSKVLVELYDYSNSAVGGIDFFVDYSRKAGGEILELGCGTGRVLIPTAVAGLNIMGLDISSYMIEKCQAKLNLESSTVRNRVGLVQGNMTNFSIGKAFSLITPYNTFQHLITVEEQRACLKCVHNHLFENGSFVLDVFNPDLPRLHDSKYQQEQLVFADMKLPDGSLLSVNSRTASFHPSRQVNDNELIYYIRHQNGQHDKILQAFPFRYFFRYEVEYLLNLCGFEVIDLFGDYDRSVYQDKSPKILAIAKKK